MFRCFSRMQDAPVAVARLLQALILGLPQTLEPPPGSATMLGWPEPPPSHGKTVENGYGISTSSFLAFKAMFR